MILGPHIAGLDPSTKRIGYARPDAAVHSIYANAGASDRGRRLSELERHTSTAIRHYPPRPALVVVEGPALHGPGVLSLVRQAEVRGVLLRLLFDLEIAFVEIAPTNLKRFATGNGGAPKAAMIARAIALGAPSDVNDDEADAYHLRRFGLLAYGKIEATEDHELDALANAGVDWPRLENRP